MTITTMKILIFLGLILLLFTTCKSEHKDIYEIPDGVILETNFIYSPFEIGTILEHPAYVGEKWRDSMIYLLNITSICIQSENINNGIQKSEKLLYRFNKKGFMSKFEYFTPKDSKEAHSIFIGNEPKNGITTMEFKKYYGEKSDYWVEKFRDGNKLIIVSHRANRPKNTSTSTKFDEMRIKIDYIDKKPSLIQFYLPQGKSIDKAKDEVSKMGLTEDDIKYADRKVTFTQHNLPIVTHKLTSDWQQTDLLESWQYNDFKTIKSYQKFVNNTLVQNLTFSYSESLLLESLKLNNITYSFTYN